jgi:uncharacterized membrane protein
MTEAKVPSNEPALQHRRAEKAWMFRDSERSWIQFTYTIIAAAQAVLLAVLSIAARSQSAVSRVTLYLVFVVTAILFIYMFIIAAWRSWIDSMRATHYETSILSAQEQKQYNHKAADERYKWHDDKWRKVNWAGFVVAALFLIGTGYLLFCSVTQT